MPHHWLYRRSAHQDCTLKLWVNPKDFKLPVIFHNLCGYDSHFIMQEIGAIGKEHDLEINCIPNNMEKYVAFMLGKHLVFMDRFQGTLPVSHSGHDEYRGTVLYDGQNSDDHF